MITEKFIPSDLGSYLSAHNDLFFVVDSDHKANANFKYVFDIYILGVLVGRFKIFPDPSHDNYGVFNAGPIIRSYLSNTYFTGNTDLVESITSDGNFSKAFLVKYGEEYGTPVTTYTNIVTSASVATYNYYNALEPINNTSLLDAYPGKFLSSLGTSTYYVSLYDNFFLNYWPNALSTDYELNVYDSSGTLLSNDTGTTAATFVQTNLGPVGINTFFGSAKITEAAAYYTVTMGTEVLTFYLDCWTKYITQTLVFLNNLGGYESAYFRMKSRRKVGAERKTYGKNNYGVNASGEVSYKQNGNVQYGNSQVYSVKQTNKYSLCTDLLTDEQFEWLANLFQSSQVYMEFKTVTKHGTGLVAGEIMTEGGVTIKTEGGADLLIESSGGSPIHFIQDSVSYMPVKILSDNYDMKTRAADKLNPLELEVEVLQTYNSQFA